MAAIATASDRAPRRRTAVLRDHPEIRRVSIEGHTDSRGDDSLNLQLSDGRAKAVLG